MAGAYGYAKHGPECRDQILDLVRLEIESCDSLGGLLIAQSLAGGTGSGVGTFLTECVADAYPDALRLNSVVWPYRHGEVIVQNYNAMLTLASLYEVSGTWAVRLCVRACAMMQSAVGNRSPNSALTAFSPVRAVCLPCGLFLARVSPQTASSYSRTTRCTPCAPVDSQ